MDPPPGHFKLFGSFLPMINPPEMPAIANPPPPPPSQPLQCLELLHKIGGSKPPETPANANPPPPPPQPISSAKRPRSHSTKASSSDKKVRPPKKIPRKWPQVPPQPLPQEYRDSLHELGGSNPTHIYSRTLFASDVKKGLNRLNIPPAQLIFPLVAADDEKDAFLRGKDANNSPNKLQVQVMAPGQVGLTVRTMSLAMWNYREDDGDPAIAKNRSWWYALYNNWNDFVDENGLVEGSAIQIWSFRINGELCFFIHKVASQQAEGSISHGGDKSVILDGSSSSGSNNNDTDLGGDPGSSSTAVACAQ